LFSKSIWRLSRWRPWKSIEKDAQDRLPLDKSCKYLSASGLLCLHAGGHYEWLVPRIRRDSQGVRLIDVDGFDEYQKIAPGSEGRAQRKRI
jgi:hypothetical protein